MQIDIQSHDPNGLNILYRVETRDNGRTYWTRVGTALTSRDGSLHIRLDVPVMGHIVCRAARPQETK